MMDKEIRSFLLIE